jgi:hypothetical protein
MKLWTSEGFRYNQKYMIQKHVKADIRIFLECPSRMPAERWRNNDEKINSSVVLKLPLFRQASRRPCLQTSIN